jgi:hypothetical protein
MVLSGAALKQQAECLRNGEQSLAAIISAADAGQVNKRLKGKAGQDVKRHSRLMQPMRA